MTNNRSNRTHLARSLRRNQADAEQLLWYKLRSRQIYNFKFRRQFSLPPYIADFCCEEAKLIIELDGGQHVETGEADATALNSLNVVATESSGSGTTTF